jgi:hypothetical protein
MRTAPARLAGCTLAGSELTVHDAVGLEDAQLDAILAAHVPPTEDARKNALAARDIDALALKAFALAIFDEIDGRHPQNTVNRAAFRSRAIAYLKALL